MLERRLALAVSTGSQGFLAFGGTTTDTGNLPTATVFTLANLVTNGSNQGYFAGLPTQFLGNVTFDVSVDTSLSFSSPAFGSFTSTAIIERTNTVSPSSATRTFYVLGTFTGGTFGGPVTPDPTIASITIGFTQTPPALGVISSSATLSIPPATTEYLVAADDVGCESVPRVYVIDAYSGAVTSSFVAYAGAADATFRGGVRVAIGDVDGDRVPDVVTAPGPGRVGQVRVFDLQGVEKTSFRFRPFGGDYRAGIEIAVGDLDGDGRDDLVAAASRGPGLVRVASSTGTSFVGVPSKSFTAFSESFTGGATVAVSGPNRIVVGSGPGMRAMVKVYDVSGPAPTWTSFLPGVPAGTGGVSVTAQAFAPAGAPQIMVAGGRRAFSAIGVYGNTGGQPLRVYDTLASRPKPNAPVYAAAAALGGRFVDTVFMAQGAGGSGPIVKVNAVTGAVDNSFLPAFNGEPLSSPLRIATRAPRATR